jgi:hypothetical protein
MELAVSIFGVDYVAALGRFMIALNPFRADGHSSQRYFICLEGVAAAEQCHCVGGFKNDDFIGLSGRCRNATKRRYHEDQEMNAALAHILA